MVFKKVAVFLGLAAALSDFKQLVQVFTTIQVADAGVKELLRKFRTANIDCIAFQKKQNVR